ncbi:four helix bundle protein [Nibribacter koreensis]|uniref:Four helix bundle protein n=1 Tax=Nibribacter koreensis TaxID=1084519 RepID=A0ABP8FUY5_9BACT
MHNFRELKVWQEAISLAKQVYEMTAKFPANEKYGLTSQMNRAVVSIASNIAEGAGRNSDKEFVQFLSIALGSAFEVDTQLVLANEFQFLSETYYKSLTIKLNEVQRMLYGFQQSIIRKIKKSSV